MLPLRNYTFDLEVIGLRTECVSKKMTLKMLKFEMMTAGKQTSAKCRGRGGSLHTFLKRKYSENIVVMGEIL